MTNQSETNLIRQFCFQEPTDNHESVIFAGTCNYSNNKVQRYSVKEGSSTINYDPLQDKTINEEVRSIYAAPGVNCTRFIMLTRQNETSENRIGLWYYINGNSEMHQYEAPSGVIVSKRENIAFCHPVFDNNSKSYTNPYNYICYATDLKFYVRKYDQTEEEYQIGNEINQIQSGTSISNNSFVVGCGNDLLHVDTRTNQVNKLKPGLHSGLINDIQVSPVDFNQIYTGGFDGLVKHIDIRQPEKFIDEVFSGDAKNAQCPVMHVAPHPKDCSIFATAAFGNIDSGYVKIFKNGKEKYHSISRTSSASTAKAMWIDWSNENPSLLVSVDSLCRFKSHHFYDIDFI